MGLIKLNIRPNKADEKQSWIQYVKHHFKKTRGRHFTCLH